MTVYEGNRRYNVQLRAYVGPPWRRSDAAEYWDWTALNLAAYTPAPTATTLDVDVDPAVDSVVLADAGDFPTAGGCWLGPGTRETWEYVTYTGKSTNTLTGVTRETISAEQTGHHASGSAVRFWWPLTLDSLTYTGAMDDALASSYWSAELRGHNYPQAALRNRQLCIVQARWAEGAGGDWGNWQTELIGWLLNPQLADKAEDPGAWQCELVSSRQMLDLVSIGGLRVGLQNIATSGSADASPELAAAYKEYGSGEFSSAQPDVGPASVLDADMATLYISERHVGAANPPAGTGYAVYAPDQVHIAPYTGQAAGTRWIQMQRGPDEVDWGVKLINTAGYYPGDARGGLWWNDGSGYTGDDTHPLVLVESAVRFKQENPEYGDCTIFEIDDTVGFALNSVAVTGYTAKQWWDGLAPGGGSLLLLISQGASLDNVAGGVVWGTTSVNDPTWWTGASMAAIAPGQTLRRTWSSNTKTAADWTCGRASTPGYFLQLDEDDNPPKLWLDVQARPIGLRLRDAIDDSQTTGIYITSDVGDTLDGLADEDTIQIGNEQIHYTEKGTGNTLGGTVTRGANGTTVAAHAADDLIYVVAGDVATTAPLLSAIHIKRGAGLPVPKAFTVRGSAYEHVRTPDDEDYTADFTDLATVTDNADETAIILLWPSARYHHILIEVTAMTTDPYRLMLNEVELHADLSVYASTRTVTTATIAEAIWYLLALAGFPVAAYLDISDTPTVIDYTTAGGMCGGVCADLADYGGCRFAVGRDSKITVQKDPFWASVAPPTENVEWLKALASSLDAEMAHGLNVSQVALSWRDATNATQGVVRYPTTAANIGEVVEIGPYYYADATAALAGATKRFWQLRRPYGVLVAAAGPAWLRDAGEGMGIYWQAVAGNVLDRLYLAQQAQHACQGGVVESVFTMLQISGSDET